MPQTHFQALALDLIGKIADSCGEWKAGENARIASFLTDLENAAGRFAQRLHSGEASFGKSDMPQLLVLGWLAIRLARSTPGKKKGKRTVSTLISEAIFEAHAAQHVAWGEQHWAEAIPPNNNWLAPDFMLSLARRENAETIAKYQEMPDAWLEDLIFSYSVCGDFFMGKGAKSARSKFRWPGSEKLYVIEMPRRRCPSCGITSWPVIDFRMGLVLEHGFIFKCQFCGRQYGLGGRRKSLYSGGKRVVSTAWPAVRMRIDYCQICGIGREELEENGETLQAHHVLPVSEGGEDAPANILVLCPDCHAEVHRRREARGASIVVSQDLHAVPAPPECAESSEVQITLEPATGETFEPFTKS